MKTHLIARRFILSNIGRVLLIFTLMLISSISLIAANDIEVTGYITELGTDYLIVQGYKFNVDGYTDLRGPQNTQVQFSFFQLNNFVQVQGDSLDNGTYLATRVKSADGAGNENEIELTGYVTEIETKLLVINGLNFFVDANTEYRGMHGMPFLFEQIEVGMLLELKAKLQSNNDLLAIRVKTEDDEKHGEELEVTGNIDNLTVSSVILGQWEFFVDAQTIILDDNKMPITFADLNVGDKIEVKSIKQLDNTHLASSIKLEDQLENNIELTAQIESIVNTDITIGGIAFATDSNTVFLDHNRMLVTLAGLSEGMWVEVKGFKKIDGTYNASKIKIEDFVRTEIEIRSNITEITPSYFVVNSIICSVDSTTQVFDHLNKPIFYSDLLVGQLVEVEASKTGESTANARRIKVEDNTDIEMFGKITAINADNLELKGLTVFVNDNTVYLDHRNQPITFTDLSVDLFVEIKMVKNQDNSFLALRIKIEDGTNFSKINGFTGIVNGSVIQLLSGSYTINAGTIVIDNNYKIISANQLVSGQQVTLWAITDATNKTALQIQSKIVSPTGVSESPLTANDFELEQNYPNPFNPSTTISFVILSDQFVTLKVFNALGEEVKTLINTNITKGTHNIKFDSTGLSSGFYLYRLESGNQVQVKKMILMK